MALTDFIARKNHGLMRRLGFVGSKIDPFAKDVKEIDPRERERSDMHRLFYENDGPTVHKWGHYLSIYDRHLAPWRGKPVRMLEIGVFRGGSLHLWRRYLGSKATIFGIDIDPACKQFDGDAGQVRIGSQADPVFLDRVVAEMGGIDIVIDDGSHVAEHQRVSFETLFPLLSANGLYICEDLHTSYWRGYPQGGYRRKTTFIERSKRLVDDIHADFHGKRSDVSDAHRSIDGVHFYNSMVVIEKAPQERPWHTMVSGNS